MKRFLTILYILCGLAVLAGCGDKNAVLEPMDAAMLAGYEVVNAAVNISQARQSGNVEEMAVVVEAGQQVQSAQSLRLQALQASIFRDFVNRRANSLQADIATTNDSVGNFAGHIAITFDDGPHPVLTPMLLDALDERDIKATFFLLGREVDRYPDIVARMYAAGHSIGNHSYRHPRFIDISRQRIVDEIESTNRSIQAATGSLPTLLRPPYGARNNTVLDVARDMDMSVVLWSVDPRDWDHRNALIVSDTIVNYASDGSVVLLHDIHETSIEAAVLAIDALVARGYVFVTVEELFGLSEVALQAGEVYRSVYHSLGVSQ